ncbi:hydrogenase expression/formation protein [Zoogloea sp.]|uniref:hydrogenase expression/formation protein n=1 Tax=Zoogloea sp. TaxID=49181 RepID=UPI002CC2B84A|nr:hydrogenase expression/formation protein [Zoogloea sp.]HNH17839.1 hydrogenase expression/formation protein [Zoogloea sp.]
MKPFPIPVVPVGPGSQTDEAPDYLAMPGGMATFQAPRLPEGAQAADVAHAASLLAGLVDAMAGAAFDGPPLVLPLDAETPGVREVLTQSLGFGEVSAFTVAPTRLRVQETAFASLWRVLEEGEDGRLLHDRLTVCPVPPELYAAMRATARPDLVPPVVLPGMMNGEALLAEVRQQAAAHRARRPAHVINLTLLPVSEADLDYLYGALGHREVSILSRGYGNCRVTSTRLAHVWWVQYFNSMDTLILNTLEVVDMPDVVLAAEEDFRDSIERLREYVALLAEA